MKRMFGKRLEKALFMLFVNIIIVIQNSCSFTSNASKKLLNRSMTKSYDMLIVPGYPFQNGKWEMPMKARIYWAKYLYEKGIAKNIMFSGAAVYTPYVEAEIMALYAEAVGIPKENIFTETKAEHSTENVYYSFKKARKNGFQKIALATDPFQAKMLRKFIIEKVDTSIDIIPFVYDTLKKLDPYMTDPVIDYEKAYVKDFVSIKNREGLLKRLKGTSGKDIDYSLYE